MESEPVEPLSGYQMNAPKLTGTGCAGEPVEPPNLTGTDCAGEPVEPPKLTGTARAGEPVEPPTCQFGREQETVEIAGLRNVSVEKSGHWSLVSYRKSKRRTMQAATATGPEIETAENMRKKNIWKKGRKQIFSKKNEKKQVMTQNMTVQV